MSSHGIVATAPDIGHDSYTVYILIRYFYDYTTVPTTVYDALCVGVVTRDSCGMAFRICG